MQIERRCKERRWETVETLKAIPLSLTLFYTFGNAAIRFLKTGAAAEVAYLDVWRFGCCGVV